MHGRITYRVHVEVLHSADCPHWQAVRDRIGQLAAREGIQVAIAGTMVDDLKDAVSRGYRGSPTVLVDGKDIEP